MTKNGTGYSKRKLKKADKKADSGQRLSLMEWMVVGTALGFVLTAVASAMYVHGLCR